MRNLKDIVFERLVLSKNKPSKEIKELNVTNLIEALYNYGPAPILMKDCFGRKQVKINHDAKVTSDEKQILGERITEIYYFKEEPWRNRHGSISFYSPSINAAGGSTAIVCKDNENEKLESLFKPGVLEELYEFLILNSKV